MTHRMTSFEDIEEFVEYEKRHLLRIGHKKAEWLILDRQSWIDITLSNPAYKLGDEYFCGLHLAIKNSLSIEQIIEIF